MSTGHPRIAVGGGGLGMVSPKPKAWEGGSPGDAALAVAQVAVDADEQIGTTEG
jgi:hypothetical protein